MALTDKIEYSIDLLRKHEANAIRMNPDGYYLSFSGGKDSQVVYELCKIAGVKFKAHFSCTTIDPKEVLRFIHDKYPDVIWHRPEKSMFKLIEENRSLPLRQVPYCCRLIKEVCGINNIVLNGVRRSESIRRQKITDSVNHVCIMGQDKFVLSPILYWTTANVWNFVRNTIGYYCELYDKGFHRVGCVFCPNATPHTRYRQLELHPRFKYPFLKAIQKCIDYGNYKEFENSEDVFNWWISGKPMEEYIAFKNQGKLDF